MKTVKELVSKSNISEGLIRAVVRQNGGWESFKQAAQDIAEHGARAKWQGFTYHTDTVKFFTSYRDLIRQLAHHVAARREQSTIEMIHSFRCLDRNFSEDEIGVALYGPKSKIDTQIANALAWFTLEKVAEAYTELTK